MKRIRILPEILANKIAAGEVVERPASVVKELVENALDAQSTRIVIDIDNGGRSSIRVGDDGTGMHPDDALLALERFATSKIHSDQDLYAIETLGFRGEALPSMAAVSKMTLVTRPRGADTGVEVRIHGGRIMDVTETGAAQGTVVSVERLFYNTPARRKFLKTIPTEMGHIADTVAGMALGRPRVHFKLTHNGRTVKQWTRTSDARTRVAEVLGQVAAGDLIELKADAGPLRLNGHLGPARLARSTSRGIYLYVNGRRVRDRVIQHALFEGYGGRLMKGRFPLAVLFLELPFDQVDVNVHPTKHEIRFADQRRVHRFVHQQVADTLGRTDRRLWAAGTEPVGESPAAVAQPVPTYRIEAPKPPAAENADARTFDYSSPPDGATDRPMAKPVRTPGAQVLTADDTEVRRSTHDVQQKIWDREGFADLQVIGQFQGTYLICQGEGGLILIDQHAAHERVVYERLGRRTSGRIESQRLLMPETVELGFAGARVLGELIPRLDEMGLEIEPFGGTTFVIKSAPALLDDHNLGRLVADLVDKAVETGLNRGLEQVLDECRKVMACHRAVRANQRLTDEQIRQLLDQLDRCREPSHCPHGRPTWIQWTPRDLEKAFKRIV